jgi:hypothetical protein
MVLKIKCLRAGDPDVLHRFHNFGEEVYRRLRDSCEIDIDEIDGNSGEFILREVKSRSVRWIQDAVLDLAGQHMMAADLQVIAY